MSGTPIGAAPALRPDVLLLHAPAADEDGNIVLVGARAMDLVMVPASRQVLATVDAVIPRDELRRIPAGIVIARQFVSAIAVEPGAAAPTSSLPYYLADFDSLRAWAAADEPLAFARAHSSGRHDGAPGAVDPAAPRLSRLPEIDEAIVAAALPAPPDDASPATPDEWMTVWLAREYPDGSVCSVGAVSPLASASYLLAKATTAPSMTLITNGGCYIDVGWRPVLFGLGEWLDSCSALTIMGGEESYEWFYQAGLVSFEVVSVAQIDAIRPDQQPRGHHAVRAAATAPRPGRHGRRREHAPPFVIYLPRQSPLNTPERVEFSTAARGLLCALPTAKPPATSPARWRSSRTSPSSGSMRATGRFRVAEVFPWTTFPELREATGFELGIDVARRHPGRARADDG